MSTKDSAEISSIATGSAPSIDADRFARALSAGLTTDRISEGLYRVTSGEESYIERVSTEFVARVAGFTRDHGCPSRNERLCDGPLGPRLPCPACCDGLRSESIDEYDVWNAVVSEERT
jgi:hypothetical protein